jgi:hydroxymethylglutaryl-CoA reductase (NADPH)
MTLERNKRIRFSEQDRKDRLAKLKNKTGQALPSYNSCSIDPRSVAGHIENYVGTISIPVGIAGPLDFNFVGQTKEIYAPIATTEGALVSSIQRGALAMKLSGGVTTRSLGSRMIRAPQFTFNSIDSSVRFSNWIATQLDYLSEILEGRSRYCRLINIEPKVVGRTVHVRFIYKTGNAAGQNMTTFATSLLCQNILDQWHDEMAEHTDHRIVDFIIEGNLASDKKVTHWSASEGRGRSVVAECVVKASVIRRVLKMDPATFVGRFQLTKSAQGHAGFLGYNINVANVVAALFASTGQDLASIHESSIGEFNLVQHGDDILATLHMPSLVVGTAGGGVSLPSFRDNLALLGCDQGEDSADRLAQIICGFALGLELSTVAAIGSNTFVEAHEKFGRKALSDTVNLSDLNFEFFKKSFNENVKSIKKIKADNRQGYMTEMARQVSKNYSGMLAYEVETQTKIKKTFLKLKASDREVIHGCARIVESINPGLAELLVKNRKWLPFYESHLREIEVLSKPDTSIQAIAPKFYGSFIDEKKEVFILIQELLENNIGISDLNLSKDLSQIDEHSILNGILSVHADYFNDNNKVRGLSSKVIKYCDLDFLDEQEEMWFGMSMLIPVGLREKYTFVNRFLNDGLDNFAQLLVDLDTQNKSLIHFDFNPRNVAFDAVSKKFYIFDWEFAAWGPPQRDLMEWIVFTSTSSNVIERLCDIQEFSLQKLSASVEINLEQWQKGFKDCYTEFLVRRLPFYIVLGSLGMNIKLDEFYGVLNELGKHFAESR